MSFIPKIELYQSNGTTLQYTFPVVQSINAPQTISKNVVVEGIRGQGCIIIPGSSSSWDLEIRGIFLAADYSAVTALIDDIETDIVLFTNYVLKFEKTISTSYTYNVQRIEPIQYPNSMRVNFQDYIVKLKVGAW
jgi:hypothetical protein